MMSCGDVPVGGCRNVCKKVSIEKVILFCMLWVLLNGIDAEKRRLPDGGHKKCQYDSVDG
jgi:hypothetical protein